MKQLWFMGLCLAFALLFSACEKDEVSLSDQSRMFGDKKEKLYCEDRITVPMADLADVGKGFQEGWFGGELDRILRDCEIGPQTTLCDNFSGYEDINFCCFSLFDFNLDQQQQSFNPEEQELIIDFILQEVASVSPPCSDAKLVAIDVYRKNFFPWRFGFTARYMCCGENVEF